MAHLRFEIKGKPGSITLRAFQTAVESWMGILNDLDAGISGQKGGSLDWVVTDLSMGSLALEIESRSRMPGKDYGPRVVRANIEGMEVIENEEKMPPYLTESGMKKAQRMVNLIGRQGTTGFLIANTKEKAELSIQSKNNVKSILKPRYQSIGSVEGRLETISLHRSNRLVIYESLTNKAVSCIFKEDKLPEVKALLGHRVNVFGTIYRNKKGDALSVEVKELRKLREVEEIPSFEKLLGIDPDFTGELTTADYLRSVRGA
jgi:hypothetical protein